MSNVWVIVPAYNEEATIVAAILALKPLVSQVLVVDDGSQDKTAALAKQSGALVVSHSLNCGQGAALQTGFDYAWQQGAEIFITFDADLQNEPLEIKRFLDVLQQNPEVEVVLGSRFKQKNQLPKSRWIISNLARLFDRFWSGLPLTDAHNGFRAFRRSAIEKLEIKQPGMAHASEIVYQIAKLNLKYQEVPVTVKYFKDRPSQGFWQGFLIIKDLILAKVFR